MTPGPFSIHQDTHGRQYRGRGVGRGSIVLPTLPCIFAAWRWMWAPGGRLQQEIMTMHQSEAVCSSKTPDSGKSHACKRQMVRQTHYIIRGCPGDCTKCMGPHLPASSLCLSPVPSSENWSLPVLEGMVILVPKKLLHHSLTGSDGKSGISHLFFSFS